MYRALESPIPLWDRTYQGLATFIPDYEKMPIFSGRYKELFTLYSYVRRYDELFNCKGSIICAFRDLYVTNIENFMQSSTIVHIKIVISFIYLFQK